MMNLPLRLSLLSYLLVPASGFIFGEPLRPNPSLAKYTDSQTGTMLDLRLVVGREDQDAQMGMDGLRFQLSHDKATDKHPQLPGADGPTPKVSSGPRALKMLSSPSFVGLKGMETVELANGCWEMVWKDDAPAGSIICGFDVPKEACRNGVSLPEGRLYVTFPVCTPEGLIEIRAKKAEIEAKAIAAIKDRDDEMAKMNDTANPLMKALHYRNAFAAVEKYQESGIKQMSKIPLDETMPLGDDLIMVSRGTAWTKDGSFKRGKHELLGYAVARASETKGGIQMP